jgi:hypothetical protein
MWHKWHVTVVKYLPFIHMYYIQVMQKSSFFFIATGYRSFIMSMTFEPLCQPVLGPVLINSHKMEWALVNLFVKTQGTLKYR